jgi:hypothetical protein
MSNFLGLVLMAAITFPVSFWVGRTCLRGLIGILTYGSRQHGESFGPTGGEYRDVLSSQP